MSMPTETDADRPDGYYLDEQTYTHIVAAHLDQMSDYDPVQVADDRILVQDRD